MNNKYFVPFETAKQLKEKGYPQFDSERYYNLNGEIKLYQDLDAGYKEEVYVMLKYYFAAPTYHEVIDWLEGKGIYITCYAPIMKKYIRHYTAGVFNSNANDWGMRSTTYPTREEALNAAILKALEMI